MTAPLKARRAGFTLIELLVVILIIAVLAGLLLAAFGPARTAVRVAQAKIEIRQIDTAIEAFKVKMNVQTIPAFRPGTADGSKFRLRKTYQLTDPEFAYLRQVFPLISEADTGWAGSDQALEPNQVLLFFLTGIDQQGFSNNKQRPFTPANANLPNETRNGPFYTPRPGGVKNGFLVDLWDIPYAYFAFDQSLGTYPFDANNPTALAWPTAATMSLDNEQVAPNGVRAYFTQASPTSKAVFLNAKGWQIVSAGPDQKFGRGGNWVPGQDDYVSNAVGGDDVSNFNEGSLNQQGK